MIGKRIGHWSWTLTVDERKTAAAVVRCQRERIGIPVRLGRKHEAMLAKQRKLDKDAAAAY